MSLTAADSWSLGRLLDVEPADPWPTPTTYDLSDLCRRLYPAESKTTERVVRPGDVDRNTGMLHPSTVRRSDLTYRRSGGEGLLPGDLLISSGRPVVLVQAGHRGWSFSSRFLAARPDAEVDGLWIWACLNTTAGVACRRAAGLLDGARTTRPLRLGDLRVPALPAHWHQVRPRVLSLAASIGVAAAAQDAGQSWWRMTSLPADRGWSELLLTQDLGLWAEGRPLSEVVSARGYGKKPKLTVEAPVEGWLPVVGVPQLRGKPPVAYAPASEGVVVEPGNVLVQRVGIKGIAAVVTRPSLADTGVLWARPKDTEDPTQVVASLNSGTGQRQRALLLGGATIPTLSLTTLLNIRIVDDPHPPEQTGATLAQQLDELVWR